MPLYEYECRACGVRFERRQGVHDEPVSVCPDCSGSVRRVLFPVGIIFKGSGFYQTDYRSEGYKKSAAAEAKSTESSSVLSPAVAAAAMALSSITVVTNSLTILWYKNQISKAKS